MKKFALVFCSFVATFLFERIASGVLERGIGYLISNNYFYSNWVYRRIAEGVRINLSFYIIVFLLIMVSIVFVISNNKNKKKKDKCKKACKECEKKHSLRCVFIKICDWYKHTEGYVAILIAMWGVAIAFLSLTNFINHTIIRISNDIEIVAPFITDNEYKGLKSEFYMIDNYDDYKKLMLSIDRLAKEHDVNIK